MSTQRLTDEDRGTSRTTGVGPGRGRYRSLVAALVLAVGVAACGGDPDLDTRRFELEHVEPEEAATVIEPYVFTDRPGASGALSHYPGGITVRETPDNLDKIARVLERLDKPKPGVRLNFRIVEANGDSTTDPRLADIEEPLRQLFRFDGYRLVAEARTAAVEGGSTTQMLREEDRGYGIMARVGRITTTGDRGSVELHVELFAREVGSAISTSMTVPVGQTVVLGSAKLNPDSPVLILTVRPEFVSLPPGEGREPGSATPESGASP